MLCLVAAQAFSVHFSFFIEVDTQSADYFNLTPTLHYAYPRAEGSWGRQIHACHAHRHKHNAKNDHVDAALFSTYEGPAARARGEGEVVAPHAPASGPSRPMMAAGDAGGEGAGGERVGGDGAGGEARWWRRAGTGEGMRRGRSRRAARRAAGRRAAARRDREEVAPARPGSLAIRGGNAKSPHAGADQ